MEIITKHQERPFLAVDMDETLADTKKEMQKLYFRDFGEYMPADKLHGQSVKEAIPADRYAATRKYLLTPGFFRHIELFPDAREVMKELNEKYRLFVVSAATEFPDSLKDKLEWMLEYLPFLGWEQLCLCGDKSLVQTDIIIDDRSRNFKYFKGKAYLFTAHHNVMETAYERVNDWKEIAAKLL